jgi:hypothetical protein
MKLSIITITCRRQAALDEMARAIGAVAAKAKGIDVEWIIVDEHGRTAPVIKGVATQVVKPKRSKVRPAPATARARNTGLGVASGDYVVFIDDNRVPTESFGLVMAELAKAKQGYRPHLIQAPSAPTFVVPEDGVVGGAVWEEQAKTVPTKATNVSSCFGAPMAAFQKVKGFDESFDGESKWGDTECAVRLERSGVPFVTTKQVAILLLHRSKDDGAEIVEPRTNNNAKHWAAVMRDKDRITPTKGGIIKPEPAPVPSDVGAVDSGSDDAPAVEPAAANGNEAAAEFGDVATDPGTPRARSTRSPASVKPKKKSTKKKAPKKADKE